MPKTKDGGFLLDDRPMISVEEQKKIDALLKAGKRAEATALFNKIVDARMEYENSVVDVPTKKSGGKNAKTKKG